MFVQITNGRSAERRLSPIPRKVDSQEEEVETVEKNISFEKNHVRLPRETFQIDEEPSNTVSRLNKGELFIDRFSEKATKYLKKKPNIKLQKNLFREKESDITIYTIDKEIGRRTKNSHCERSTEPEIFSNSEFTERIQVAKQSDAVEESRFRSVGSLAINYPPYRLFFLPPNGWKNSDSMLETISKLLLCQCAFGCFLIIWLFIGALSIYLIESSYEHQKVEELQLKENSLIISLATDLRLLNPEETIWKDTIQKYTMMHKNLIVENSIYSHEGHKTYWSFTGSLLFIISLINTFGLATPSPSTIAGNITAFILAILGIPIHFVFITNLGRTLAIKIQIYSKELANKISMMKRRIINVRRFGEDIQKEKDVWPDRMFLIDFQPPQWLKWFPVITSLVYYTFGVVVFGLARDMHFPTILWFPSDFASHETFTSALSKMGYAWFIECATILTSVNIALLRDSPLISLTHFGIGLNFLTNSLDF